MVACVTGGARINGIVVRKDRRQKERREKHFCMQVGPLATLLEKNRHYDQREAWQNGTLQELRKDTTAINEKVTRIESTLSQKEKAEVLALSKGKNSIATWSLRIAIAAVILSFIKDMAPYVISFFKWLAGI